MPELCRFQNIIIRMFFGDVQQHHMPHFHVEYAEYKAVFSIKGELLSGSLPVKQTRLVLEWVIIHESEIYEAWKLAVQGIPFGKIEPLK